MKKHIIATVCMMAAIMVFAACSAPEETARHPVARRYTAAHIGQQFEYVHKYDWYKDDWVLVPQIIEISVPDKWEILFRITYSDGSVEERWEEVSKEEYDAAAVEAVCG